MQSLKRGIARIQRVIRKKETGENDTNTSDSRITVEELRLAEVVILKSLQQRYFKEEVEILQSIKRRDAENKERERTRLRNQRIKASSSLYRLDHLSTTKVFSVWVVDYVKLNCHSKKNTQPLSPRGAISRHSLYGKYMVRYKDTKDVGCTQCYQTSRILDHKWTFICV